MNKVSDKLVPKELAPFLPIAAALVPGLGLGSLFPGMSPTMLRYLVPQLTTALSSAKMTGEVDPKLQALAAGQSFLQGPQQQTAAEAKLIQDNPELASRLNKVNTLEDGLSIDASKLRELSKQSGNQIAGLDSEGINRFLPDFMATGPEDVLQFGQGDEAKFFLKGSDDLSDFLNIQKSTPLDLSKFTGDELIEKLKTKDFDADKLNKLLGEIEKGPKFADPRKTLQGDSFFDFGKKNVTGTRANPNFEKMVSGKTFGADALNSARGFMGTDLGFNKATALKAGVGATPYLMNQADIAAKKIEEENAAADAANQSYRDASSALSNFFVNRDPNYNMLYGYNQGGRVGMEGGGMLSGLLSLIDPRKTSGKVGLGLNELYDVFDPNYALSIGSMFGLYNQGGRVGLDEGGFLSNILGDSTVDNIQRKLLGIMGATDSMLGMGMSEYDDAFQEMLDSGATEEEIIDMLGPRPDFTMQANGGRVNKNMGGIMNAGSIPQTPMVPQGQQLDGRGGGFIPMGAQEKKDDVPAMLAKNEFVMTSDAVRAAGGGSIEKGAQKMYDLMNSLEAQV